MKNLNKSKLEKNTLFDYVNIFIMLIVLVVTIYPVWYVLCISLSSVEGINSGTVSIWPKGLNFEAYVEIFQTPKIPRAYMNSIIYTVLGTIFNLGMTVLFAYPLSRKEFMYRKPLMIMVVITMYFQGGLIPTFLLVQNLSLVDTMWSLILPNMIWTFDLIVIKSFFEGIPNEIYEAAVIDGADEFTIMTRIFIPLAKPAIASIALFFAMGHWNSYLIPSIYISSPEKQPLQVVLRDMLISDTGSKADLINQSKFTPEALKNATIFVSILPFLIAYPWLQKFFIKGLTVGAVKG